MINEYRKKDNIPNTYIVIYYKKKQTKQVNIHYLYIFYLCQLFTKKQCYECNLKTLYFSAILYFKKLVRILVFKFERYTKVWKVTLKGR